MAEYTTPLMPDEKYGNMTLGHAAKMAEDPEVKGLLLQLARRVHSAESEMAVFRQWCDRADKLYYAEHFTGGGADLWWDDPSATTPGRSHVSLNTPPPMVDIPAALQSVEPIENMLATDTTPGARSAASALERIYSAWKAEEDFELKFHKVATIKALYGRTAARVYWNDGKMDGSSPRPCIEVIQQPRNLYMGYKADDYEELEWVAYVTRMDPNAVVEAYGVNVGVYKDETGKSLPFVSNREDPYETDWSPARQWLDFGNSMVEVWDYWYRMPLYKNGKYTGMVTYNLVTCGNIVLRGPTPYKEYKGDLPYVAVFNTFVPGLPTGRAELYDAEQIIREKQEIVTRGSQMITNATAGDYWQLTGENAPMRVPANLKPKRNELVGPGPGNRIEVITPFVAQFQLEQYLTRLDREQAVITGLNDLLLGLAPAQVLSSSKAINALIANYESRLSMRRKLFYKFRRELWELGLKVWTKKNKDIASVVAAGGGRLDIVDPSLSPRDDMETAQRALNLVAGKLMAQRTGMDLVGIDDPETEQDMIREESTDAALWPDRVMLMAQLLQALQSMGIQAPQDAQAQAQGQAGSAAQTLQTALQGQVGQSAGPTGSGAGGAPEQMPQQPPVAGADNGQGAPFAQTSQMDPALLQSMTQGGATHTRLMTQTKIGGRK